MRASINACALFWLAACGLCWLAACGLATAETFPYTATVSSLNVVARSGPTYATYSTERLAKLVQVEVCQAGPAGWVAIRPPRDAFDWLPAAAVKVASDRKSGEILADDTPVYIGSNIKKVEQHASGTKLKQGDRVQILAEKSVAKEGGAADVWFKIAPPSNEYRWVQLKNISTKLPGQLSADEAAERLAREDRYRRENVANPPGLLGKIRQGEGRDIAEAARDSEVARAQFLRRGKAPKIAGRKPLGAKAKSAELKSAEDAIGSVDIDNGTPSETLETEESTAESPRSTDVKAIPAEAPATLPRSRISLDPKGLRPFARQDKPTGSGLPIRARDTARELPKAEPPAARQPPVNTGTQVRPIDAEEFKRRLTELDIDLTSMVAEDSSKWQLTPLQQRATDLVDAGPSPLERGQARLVLDRINEFAATLPPNHEELTLTAPTGGPVVAPVPKADFTAHYDAVGYLMPIVGARPGSPQYQLTDKDGRSLSYVSAKPGINLNHYVKKQVGLYGQRGYVESLQKQHVLAERVVELDTQRR